METNRQGAGAPPLTGGAELMSLARDLYPLHRSLTGDGVRETLARLAAVLPLEVHEVPSGTAVLDWIVPPEWNVREAWMEDPSGRRFADHARCNLHLVGYSRPFTGTLSRAELEAHLHSDPAHPDVVPYRTSYYAETWGFCLTHRERQSLPDGTYRVHIDATLAPGALSYGEAFLPGDTEEECLIYTHTCHPSLANDNVSGMVVAAHLGRWLGACRRRLSYRLVFGPGTLGSITWLARNRAGLGRIVAGLVVVLVGHPGALRYKQSFSGTSVMDRAAAAWLGRRGGDVLPFEPWGYDERQFASPGFRLPVGRLSRAAEESYPEYHSSADNLDLIQPQALEESLAAAAELLSLVDQNRVLRNLRPEGEPQLGRHGLYRALGGAPSPELQRALLWLLAYGDGRHDVVDVYTRSKLPVGILAQAAWLLTAAGLLA